MEHPEQQLIGKWQEVEWVYDKVDVNQNSSLAEKRALKNDLRHQVSENLIIHKSEVWEFKDDGDLILKKENGEIETLKWRLKGRGHILKLRHSDDVLEFYQIKSLGKDSLTIHFENDNHARGIIKIVFSRS